MPAPASALELLDLVRKSGVVDPAKLDQLINEWTERKLMPEDALKTANQLMRQGFITAFQAKQLLQGRYKNFIIQGKYRLLDLLGTGGMGSVYLCEHLRFRRPVALKFLSANSKTTATAVQRFEREGRAVFSLNHPNVVRALDLDQDGKLHYLVLEYVDGVTLADLVERIGPLPLHRAADYIAQAAHGLQHAFENGMVHRDIKPSNLLLDRQGVVKILDMGLARFFREEGDGLTRQEDQAILGTADYIAPEQALHTSDVDIRADLYSLGGTFYFLLTGRPPFQGGTAAQKMLWHQIKTPDSLAAQRPDLPPEAVAIVERLMAKRPEQRFATPMEVAAALAPWTATPPPLPTEEEIPRRAPAVRQLLQANAPSGVAAPRSGSWSTVSSGIARRTGRPGSSNDFTVERQGPASSSHVHLPPAQVKGGGSGASSSASRRVQDILATPLTHWRLYGSLAAACVVLLLAAIYYLYATSPRRGSTAAKPVSRPNIRVTTDRSLLSAGEAERIFPTLAEALKVAQFDDVIEIIDATWRERIHLVGPQYNFITIASSSPSRPVRLEPPPGANDSDTLLHVENVEGLKLRGLSLHGQDRTKKLMTVVGPCPRLNLDEMSFSGFTETGLSFEAAGGEADTIRLIRLRDVKFEGGEKTAAATAIDLASGPGTKANHHILVERSTFIGPLARAVRVQSADFVNFRLNRFFQGQVAFELDPRLMLRLEISNNTIYGFEHVFAVAAGAGQRSGEPDRVIFRDNLCCQTTNLFKEAAPDWTPPDAALFHQSAGNIHDEDSLQGPKPHADFARRMKVPPMSLDPQHGDDFLRYPNTHPLMRAGANDGPVGVPPK